MPGNLDTLMAGLACGEPSLLAWQELDHAAAAFMAIPDEAAVACMRLLAGHGIVGGEFGVAGLAGCLLAAADPAARETLGLDASSRVLAFNTEGATDPALYERLVGHRRPVPECRMLCRGDELRLGRVMLSKTFAVSSGCHRQPPLTGHQSVRSSH